MNLVRLLGPTILNSFNKEPNLPLLIKSSFMSFSKDLHFPSCSFC